MRRHALIAAILVASVHALAFAREASVDWAMNATIIDGCSCRVCCVLVSSDRPPQSARLRPTSMRDTDHVTSTRRFGLIGGTMAR